MSNSNALFSPRQILSLKAVESLAVLWCNEAIDALAHYLVGAIRTNHGQTGGIHVQQSTIGGDELHAFGRGVHNRAESLLAIAQGPLDLLFIGDVSSHFGRPHHPAGAIFYR